METLSVDCNRTEENEMKLQKTLKRPFHRHPKYQHSMTKEKAETAGCLEVVNKSSWTLDAPSVSATGLISAELKSLQSLKTSVALTGIGFSH